MTGRLKDGTLSAAEERALLEAYQNDGSTAALQELVWRYRHLATYVARKFQAERDEDTLQSGMIGLLIAAQKFDLSQDVRFGTYARWWVRYYVRRQRMKSMRRTMVSTPQDRHARKVYGHQSRTAWALRRKLKREPTRAEMADALEIPVEQYERLSAYWGAPPDTPLNDDLHGRQGVDVEATLIERDDLERIFAAMGALPQREAEILHCRYMEGQSLQEIGDRMSLSRERIRQLEKRAIEQVRSDLGIRVPRRGAASRAAG